MSGRRRSEESASQDRESRIQGHAGHAEHEDDESNYGYDIQGEEDGESERKKSAFSNLMIESDASNSERLRSAESYLEMPEPGPDITVEIQSSEESRALLRARLGLPGIGESLLAKEILAEDDDRKDRASESNPNRRPLGSGTSTPKSHTSSNFINAAAKGDINTVHNTLYGDRRPDPDQKKQYQDRSALHLACGYGQLAVVKELLNAGANPDAKNRIGRTPLHEVCQGGYQDVLSLLLDFTRTVNVGDIEGQTPAHLAAFHGEVKCLELLCDKGASLAAEDRMGRTPAHLAATRNHRSVLEFLYEKGVDLDCPCDAGKWPLHYAAQHGALDSIVCLIERDSDITIGDKNGNLPIHFAASKNHLDCLRFLIRQGTSPVATQADGKTPVHVAAYHGACKVLHWLLEKRVPVDMKDVQGNTASHYAAEAGKAKCFGCLMSHGADLKTANEHGDTPLDTAKKAGNSILIGKAVNKEVMCKDCSQHMKLDAWNQKYSYRPVLKSVEQLKAQAYTNPLPRLDYTTHGHNSRHANKRQMPNRDNTTKYFGEYLHTDLYKLKFT